VSDVHDLIDWDYQPHEGGHRPVTLVLADAATPAALRQALFDGNTIVYYKDWLMGRERDLARLMPELVEVKGARYPKNVDVLELTLANRGDLPLTLELEGDMSFLNAADWVTIPAEGELKLGLKTGQRLEQVDLALKLRNVLSAPRTPFRMMLTLHPEAN